VLFVKSVEVLSTIGKKIRKVLNVKNVIIEHHLKMGLL